MNRKGTLKHHKKNAMDVIFNAKNSQLFTRFSPSEEILSVNGKNRPVATVFQLSIFVLSREKCHYKSYWIRTFRFFFLCFGFLSPLGKSERHYKRYGVFSVLGAIIRKKFDKWLWIENGEGFAVHSSIWPSGVKGEWHVSSWLAISNTREKIPYLL